MRLPVPPTVDIAIASAFVVFTAAEAVFSPGVDSPVVHLVVAGVAMAVLAWRRARSRSAWPSGSWPRTS